MTYSFLGFKHRNTGPRHRANGEDFQGFLSESLEEKLSTLKTLQEHFSKEKLHLIQLQLIRDIKPNAQIDESKTLQKNLDDAKLTNEEKKLFDYYNKVLSNSLHKIREAISHMIKLIESTSSTHDIEVSSVAASRFSDKFGKFILETAEGIRKQIDSHHLTHHHHDELHDKKLNFIDSNLGNLSDSLNGLLKSYAKMQEKMHVMGSSAKKSLHRKYQSCIDDVVKLSKDRELGVKAYHKQSKKRTH